VARKNRSILNELVRFPWWVCVGLAGVIWFVRICAAGIKPRKPYAVKELGMSGAQAARWLGIGQPAVQRSVVRGGKIARELNLVLFP
jgi:hypothetical protein